MARKPFRPKYAFSFANSTTAKADITGSATVANLCPETNNKFSWSIWFYTYNAPTTSSDARFWDKSLHSFGFLSDQTATAGTPNRLHFRATYNAGVVDFRGTQILAPNTWHHAAVTYNSGTVILYLDNAVDALSASGSAPTLDSSTASDLYLGNRSSGSRNMPGELALARMYQNYILTPADINLLFNGEEPVQAPVARYDFDEQQLTTMNDRSGNGYTAAQSGTSNSIASWKSYNYRRNTVTPPSTALNFTPNNASASVADVAILRPEATNAFTWMCWIYPLSLHISSTNAFIIEKGANYLSLLTDETSTRFSQYALEVADSVAAATEEWSSYRVNMSEWLHIATSFNNPTTVHYFNGAPDVLTTIFDGGSYTAPLGSTVGNVFNVGYRDGHLNTNNFLGYIAKVRAYNVVLTPAEIQRAYQTDDVTRGLVGRWNFDEGTGTAAIDTSGNGNNLTISGATWVTPTQTRKTAGTRNVAVGRRTA